MWLQVNDSLRVDGIDFYITSVYVEELFNSCKDVKFGTMNTRAMDFVGAGAQNYKGESYHCFMCNAWSQVECKVHEPL